MSIVGPRPHAVAHNDHYAELIGVSMRSGITSNRELQGGGETSTVRSMKERVDHDIWYVDHWSLVLDVYIILRTAVEVVRSRNAY